MKELQVLAFFVFLSIACFAQKDITKFLGIPVDGTKSEMISKLKGKGYSYNIKDDLLEGEFNGYKVKIRPVTYNNKVWRIMINDAYSIDETDIKIRFNRLCRQFEKNEKYVPYIEAEQTIPDDEDISYEILVNKKRFEAVYIQRPEAIDSVAMNEYVQSTLREIYTESQLNNPNKTFEENKEIYLDTRKAQKEYVREIAIKKVVWFYINLSNEIGRYEITMYYDNEYNNREGEEL